MKYEVKPNTTRTAIGLISVLSFLFGMYFCDLAKTWFAFMVSRSHGLVSRCLFRISSTLGIHDNKRRQYLS